MSAKERSYARWQTKKAAKEERLRGVAEKKGARESQTKRKYNDDDDMNITSEASKFMGGDLEHTHLVKGLDFALLAQNRKKLEQERSRASAAQVSLGPAKMTSDSEVNKLPRQDQRLLEHGLKVTYGTLGYGFTTTIYPGVGGGDSLDFIVCSLFVGSGGRKTLGHCQKTFNDFVYERIELEPAAGAADQIDEQWIKDAFMAYDEALPKSVNAWQPKQHHKEGATASMCLIDLKNHKVHIAHIGSSRVLVFSNCSDEIAYASRNHTPEDPKEAARIAKANGQIANGKLFSVVTMKSIDVSRAFGHRVFKGQSHLQPKEQILTPECDYHCIDLVEWVASQQAIDTDSALGVFIASSGVYECNLPDEQKHTDSVPESERVSFKAGTDVNERLRVWCTEHTITHYPHQFSKSLAFAADELSMKASKIKGGADPLSLSQASLKAGGQGVDKSQWGVAFLSICPTQELIEAANEEMVKRAKEQESSRDGGRDRDRGSDRDRRGRESDRDRRGRDSDRDRRGRDSERDRKSDRDRRGGRDSERDGRKGGRDSDRDGRKGRESDRDRRDSDRDRRGGRESDRDRRGGRESDRDSRRGREEKSEDKSKSKRRRKSRSASSSSSDSNSDSDSEMEKLLRKHKERQKKKQKKPGVRAESPRDDSD